MSAASRICAFVISAASIWLSRRVVAPVVISVASALLDPDYFSCEELLVLRLLLLLLRAGAAARAIVQSRRSATMQVMNVR